MFILNLLVILDDTETTASIQINDNESIYLLKQYIVACAKSTFSAILRSIAYFYLVILLKIIFIISIVLNYYYKRIDKRNTFI
jgi:hypothetical protein